MVSSYIEPLNKCGVLKLDVLKDIGEAAIVGGASLPASAFYFIGKCIGRLAWCPYIKIATDKFSEIYISNVSGTAHGSRGFHCRLVVPIVGSAIFTAVAYISYNYCASLFALKGAIVGIHALALTFFSLYPRNEDNIISIRSHLERKFIDSKFYAEGKEYNKIDRIANVVSNITLVATSLTLTVLTQNPILAATVAYPVSAVARVAYTRLALCFSGVHQRSF